MTARYTNALVQQTTVTIGDKVPEPIGALLSLYEVQEYRDLRQAYGAAGPAGGLKAMRGYIVSLNQKLSLASDQANSFASLNQVTTYSGYPVLAVQMVTPSTTIDALKFVVEDYHPKTLNASISTSANQSTSADQANSVQYSSGSSNSVTNSYEVSDSVGFFGEAPTGSVSASLGNSTTSTVEQSRSLGQTASRAALNGTAASMTVKDWASYAFLDSGKQKLSWVWGQEYPWNVIDFRNLAASSGPQVSLPPYVKNRLWDGKFLYPPSELSQFGVDFVATARWIFYLEGDAGPEDEVVTFDHAFTYWQGTHDQTGASLVVMASNQAIDNVSLNLPLLALDPIVSAGSRNGAIIGFVKGEFVAAPASDGAPFRAKSGSNTLYATGQGFDAPATNDAVLSSTAVTAAAPAKLTLFFKVTDEMVELALHLKHWKLGDAGCVVTIAINEADPARPVSPIVRHVDARESGGGTDNLISIMLRSKDYTSNDFYDYLVVGLNTIVVTISPAQGQTTCGYALRAIAIS
jgi:hypothetical protein